MRNTSKIILTDKQEKWLVLHFKHTKNAEIAQKLGISMSSVSRLARIKGLKKTPQFRRKCAREALEKARLFNEIHRTYPPKGFHIPGREKTQFKPGVNSLQRLGKKKEEERIRKATEARMKTFREERARAVFGLPQKTNLHVIRQPRKKVLLRYYLKKRGYIIDDEKRIAYYDESTKRGRYIEKKDQPWYRFLPVNKTGKFVNNMP